MKEKNLVQKKNQSAILTTHKSQQDYYPAISSSILGGIEDIFENLYELIELPLTYPELYDWLGIAPSYSVLLHGPSGCGKTTLATAFSSEICVPLVNIMLVDILLGASSDIETKIQSKFSEAYSLAPCILLIDEIDLIATKKDTNQKGIEKKILSTVVKFIDELMNSDAKTFIERSVIFLGVTNNLNILDPILRRAGRFDREISIGIPSEKERKQILKVLCKNIRVDCNLDFQSISNQTSGFVGADLLSLSKEAATQAIKRSYHQIPNKHVRKKKKESSNFQKFKLTKYLVANITNIDFKVALSRIHPTIKREGFTTSPPTNWHDVGYLDEIREELNMAITHSIQYSKIYEAIGLHQSAGILLYGPPGCGKTLVAKAVANESSANFISIKGPEIFDKYVGESERAVRTLFYKGRVASPSIIFIDEIDALAPRRTGSDNIATERVVNQLLTEMDGIESRRGVYVIAATNRPDILDPALLRPGRFDKILFVQVPSSDGRKSILCKMAKKSRTVPEVNLTKLARKQKLNNFTGADLKALLNEACIISLRDYFIQYANVITIKSQKLVPVVYSWHFDNVLVFLQPIKDKH